jgi:hypothetical protein
MEAAADKPARFTLTNNDKSLQNANLAIPKRQLGDPVTGPRPRAVQLGSSSRIAKRQDHRSLLVHCHLVEERQDE